jgi:uncharacterized protein YoxC
MPAEMIFYISALITALGVIIGGVVAVYRVSKRIAHAIGLDEKGRTISERMERVEHQLWENGGSSLADRVNTIEMHVIKISAEVEFIKDITIALQGLPLQNLQVLQEPKRKTRPRKKSE